MTSLEEVLSKAVKDSASDIFIVAGGYLSYKVDGEIRSMDESMKLTPTETSYFIDEIYSFAKRSKEYYLQQGDDDFSFAIGKLARFRVNTYMQRGSQAAVIRVVAFDIPDYKELDIPDGIMELAELKHGMVIISGTAGSGKSTTQACIIDAINRTREAHIITLEDPIEYLHADMRDAETIRTAMTAAETGHLVIATLHTKGAVNTIDRIVDSFPADQQDQIKIQLSLVLDSIVSQQLLHKGEGGMIPAFEVMKNTPAIRNLIRDSKNYQIDNIIQTSGSQGMISMDQYILNLYQKGLISGETALQGAVNPEQMARKTATKQIM